MKKLLVSILATLYIITSSGAVVHLHYCMDKLIGWGLWEKAGKADKCDKCGMAKTGKKKSCCKDENKFVKIEKDQKTVDATYYLSQPVIAILSVYLANNIPTFLLSTSNQYSQSNAPPLTALADTYLLNCNFRI
jgi:hypothetical protein